MKCSAIILLLVFADIAFLFTSVSVGDRLDQSIANILFLSSFIFILVSFILIAVVSNMQIHPTHIDNDSIELAGVDQKFRQEVVILQAEADEAIQENRKRRPVNSPTTAKPIIFHDTPKKADEPPNDVFKFD